MGYGIDEEWEADQEYTLTDLEKRVCEHFDYDYGEWAEIGRAERNERIRVYKLCGKK